MDSTVVFLDIFLPAPVQLEQLKGFFPQGGQELHSYRGIETLDLRLSCGGVWLGMGEIHLQCRATQFEPLIPHGSPIIAVLLNSTKRRFQR
ncbi:hypothetical protein [Sphaerochaeta pleomorpha]|uniref:hypothetical protein n=1 Tax=Sphaerochaeta pleomorpha TaxID=1131707 RepID=UPI0012DDD86F|nr:hypothetical protein [Sphaerochaeta pleomorpha]